MVDHNTEEIVVIPPEKGEKTRVLLVDDSPLFLRFLAHFFRRGEYELHTAESGDKAVEQARQLQPDIVILDLEMPGLDGIETCHILRADERTRDIPVVILTTSREEEDLVKGYQLGANCYIQKPVDFNQFRKTVEQLGLFWLVVNHPPPPSAFRPK